MEKFKRILREGLQAHCEAIHIVEGKAVEFALPQAQLRQASYSELPEGAWIKAICHTLLAGERHVLEGQAVVRSSFNLQGAGKVFLVVQNRAPLALSLFMPPQGERLSQNFWEQLTAPPTPPPLVQAVSASSGRPSSVSTEANPFSLEAAGSYFTESIAVAKSPLPPMQPPLANKQMGPELVPGQDLFGMQSHREEIPAGGEPMFAPFSLKGGEEQRQLPIGSTAHRSSQELAKNAPPSEAAGLIPEDFSLASMFAPPPLASSPPVGQEAREPAINFNLATSSETLSLEELSPAFMPTAAGAASMATPGLKEDRHALIHDGLGELLPETPPLGQEQGRQEVLVNFAEELPGFVSFGQGFNPIDTLLKNMVERRASDLHLSMGQPIIFRIDGDICRMEGEALSSDKMQSYLLPIMPEGKKELFNRLWDIDFAYEIKGFSRFRVNMFRDHKGVGAVFRHIPERIVSAQELHLPPAITNLCHLAKGLVLVTGPTGSGKSTTLAAMIDLINSSRPDHILTIEDPIEFVHAPKRCLINQREVGKHTMSFAAALKAALREDPDIVLVGELRDLETTAIALETAETGHLVFATLHTNTAVSTIDRIVDQFPTDQQRIIRNMLAASMKGVVAQTLCKRKGGGRCAAFEILITNEAISAMIREGKNHMINNQMQTQQGEGNCLLNESLLRLVADGQVDFWEAWKKAIDKKDFEELVKRRKVPIPAKT